MAGLTLALMFGAYMKLINEPFLKSKQTQVARIKKYTAQIAELNSKHPPLDEQKVKMNALGGECDRLSEEVNRIEKKLPLRKDTS